MRARSSILHRRSSPARAFMLVEVLVMVLIIPFVMVSLSSLFRTFIRDVPQGTRLVQENVTVLHLIGQMRQDMDRAIRLPDQAANRRAGDDTLLIEQPAGVICYQFENGRTVRTLLDKQGMPVPDGERIWQVRDAVIQWRPWTRDGSAYAVELHSHLRQVVAGETRRKLPGSYVFFLHGLGQEGDNP